VVGTDKANGGFGVWRRIGKSFRKHKGGLTRIAAGPGNQIWGIRADKSIYAGKLANSAEKPAKSPKTAQTLPPISAQTIKELKATLSTSNGYPGFVDAIDYTRGHMMGPDVVINQKINGQKVSVVIYTPKDKKYRNLAITAPKARLGDILDIFGIPDFFPLGLENATFVFVPPLNGQFGFVSSKLPLALRKSVQKVAPKIDLKPGLNLFSKLQSNSTAMGTKLLNLVGLPKSLNDITVEANFGLGNVITLKKKARWKNPFGLKGLSIDGLVLRASRAKEPKPGAFIPTKRKTERKPEKLPPVVRLSGWGNTRIKGKTYFLFAQHVSVKGAPVGVGYGFDAKSITLQNAVDIASTMPFLNTAALTGASATPLDQVRIENMRYRETTPTVYEPPRFEDMMIVAATANVTLPDQKPLPGLLGEKILGTPGPLLYASGKGTAFGTKIGEVDARVSVHGVSMSAGIKLKKIGPIPYSGDLTFDFGPVKSSKTFEHEMSIKGKASLHGLKAVDLVLKADRDTWRYTVQGKCPGMPMDIEGASPAHALSKIDDFNVRIRPKNCFKDAVLSTLKDPKKIGPLAVAYAKGKQQEYEAKLKDIKSAIPTSKEAWENSWKTVGTSFAKKALDAKQAVQNLRGQVTNINGAINSVKGEIGRLDNRVAALGREIWKIAGDIKDLLRSAGSFFTGKLKSNIKKAKKRKKQKEADQRNTQLARHSAAARLPGLQAQAARAAADLQIARQAAGIVSPYYDPAVRSARDKFASLQLDEHLLSVQQKKLEEIQSTLGKAGNIKSLVDGVDLGARQKSFFDTQIGASLSEDPRADPRSSAMEELVSGAVTDIFDAKLAHVGGPNAGNFSETAILNKVVRLKYGASSCLSVNSKPESTRPGQLVRCSKDRVFVSKSLSSFGTWMQSFVILPSGIITSVIADSETATEGSLRCLSFSNEKVRIANCGNLFDPTKVFYFDPAARKIRTLMKDKSGNPLCLIPRSKTSGGLGIRIHTHWMGLTNCESAKPLWDVVEWCPPSAKNCTTSWNRNFRIQ